MTHPNDIVLSMHADKALPAAEAATVQRHLESCLSCAGKVSAARQETGLIAAAFASEVANPGEDPVALSIPKFSHPAGLREFAIANLITALALWMASFLWKTLFGELVMNVAESAALTYVPNLYELISSSINHYLEQGTAMFSAYIGFVCLTVVAAALVWLALRSGRGRGLANIGLLAVLGGSVLVAEPAAALDIRYDKSLVTVGAGEIVDDTLLVAAETVLVKGNVTGDLLAAGQRIEIDGNVAGNLVAFAETVIVRGTVGGSVLSAASRVELRDAATGSDLWAAAETVTLDKESRVAGNVALAGDKTIVEGSVGRDLYAMAETLEFDGRLGDNLEAFGNRIRLLDNAYIGGDARLRIDSEANLHQAAGAQVDGQIEFVAMPDTAADKNRYLRVEFYLWQLARIVSAVLVGFALLWLFPGLRSVSISAGLEGLKSAGVGLVALLGLPLVALVAGFTLVGLPFSFFAVLVWLVVIYLAKIMVGVFVGRSVLAGSDYSDNPFLILMVGIGIVIVVVNLPWIGGLLSLVMTLVGMGLIVQRLLKAVASNPGRPV